MSGLGLCIGDYYPASMSDCDRIGMAGNCGPDCPVYLEGRCAEPQEMIPRLDNEELFEHYTIYNKRSY